MKTMSFVYGVSPTTMETTNYLTTCSKLYHMLVGGWQLPPLQEEGHNPRAARGPCRSAPLETP